MLKPWECECIDNFHKDEPDDIYEDDEGWGSHGIVEEEPDEQWEESDDIDEIIK